MSSIIFTHGRQKVVKLKNLAYVVDINGYLSKSAIYAAAYGDARVGIACEHGGTGGGHPFAGGARIPEKELKTFLYDLDDALSY